MKKKCLMVLLLFTMTAALICACGSETEPRNGLQQTPDAGNGGNDVSEEDPEELLSETEKKTTDMLDPDGACGENVFWKLENGTLPSAEPVRCMIMNTMWRERIRPGGTMTPKRRR